jgi:predicted Na+-dependent transporter
MSEKVHAKLHKHCDCGSCSASCAHCQCNYCKCTHSGIPRTCEDTMRCTKAGPNMIVVVVIMHALSVQHDTERCMQLRSKHHCCTCVQRLYIVAYGSSTCMLQHTDLNMPSKLTIAFSMPVRQIAMLLLAAPTATIEYTPPASL